MSERRPAIAASNREFADIRRAVSLYIENRHPDLWNSFYHSDLGMFLIDVIAAHGDMQSFITDRVGEEAFLATCREYRSGMHFARMLSYPVRGVASASVTLAAAGVPDALPLEESTLAAGTLVQAGGGLVFEVDRDYVFPAGTPAEGYRFTAAEGRREMEQDVSGGGVFYRYRTLSAAVIDRSWAVLVDGVPWDMVPFVELEAGATRAYSAEYDADGHVTFRFGDNVNGMAPIQNAVIQFHFRVGGGTRGNVGAGVIQAAVTLKRASGNVSINVSNPEPASGGADAETLESIKKWAPLNARTVDKCVSLQDYITHASSFSSPLHGAVARATASLRPGTLLVPEPGAFETVSVAEHDPAIFAAMPESRAIGLATSPMAGIRFILDEPATVRTVLARLDRRGTPSDLTVRVETDMDGRPSGVLAHPLAEATLPAARVYAQNWATAAFANNIGLAAGTYWLTLAASGSLDHHYTVAGDASASDNGALRVFYGGAWTPVAEVAAAAFRVQKGGSLAVPAGSLVAINGEKYTTASPIAVDGRNLSLFADPNTVDIHIWARTSGADGRMTFGPASDGLREELQAHLDARSIATVVNHVQNGTTRAVDIDLGEVHVHASYSREAMADAIHAAIAAFFTSERAQPGAPIRLSDFYAWLEAVPGVDHFVERIHRDDILAEPHEMLVRGNVSFNIRMSAFEDRPDIQAKY